MQDLTPLETSKRTLLPHTGEDVYSPTISQLTPQHIFSQESRHVFAIGHEQSFGVQRAD